MKKLTISLMLLVILVIVGPIYATTPALTNFQIMKDMSNFQGTLTIPACTYPTVEAVTTAAQSITIPAGARFVNFSGTGNFYVNFTTTAVVPTVNVADGTSAILNPGCRTVYGLTSFSIIAPSACIVTMEWYK